MTVKLDVIFKWFSSENTASRNHTSLQNGMTANYIPTLMSTSLLRNEK